MVEDGWTAEMAIPFKSLRYPASAGEGGRRWGFQITRVIRGKSEAQSWSPISRGAFLERALRDARPHGRGRLDRRDGDPVQEPPLSRECR
jgi:hypothetical protein